MAPEDDEDEAIIEKSATAAWSAVIAKVNDMKTEETGKRQFTSVSGPEYFGFGVPAIAKLIQGSTTLEPPIGCSFYSMFLTICVYWSM